MPYLHLLNKADPTKRVSWPAPTSYDPNRWERRRSAEQVVGGPTRRQSYAMEETDRTIPLAGLVRSDLFDRLSYLYALPGTDYVFSDGSNVWEVTFDDLQGRQERSTSWHTYSITFGVTRRVRSPQAPVFTPPAEVPLFTWPARSPSVVDGLNKVFATPDGREYPPGNVWVSWNGKALEPGVEYVEVSATEIQLLTEAAPSEEEPGDPDHIVFWFMTKGVPSPWAFPVGAVGAVDGLNTVFRAPGGATFHAGRVAVFLNGLLLVPGAHYVELPDQSGVAITFYTPAGEDRVMLMYLEDQGVDPAGVTGGSIVWPVASITLPDGIVRDFSLPVGQAYLNGRIVTWRSGLLLTPGVGALQRPLLASVRAALGDPPSEEESMVFLYDPY